ncbi:hypothetical protein [Priestia koreensis]|uniref:hypothetical protein n=1 Tax=Priestia koreensis TaxID=284581 RepID=UPI00301B5798
MATKRIICNFFNFSEPAGLEGKLDLLFEGQKEILNKNKVENVEVAGNILRITFLEKNIIGSNHWWTGIVEKLDITEQGEISNLEGQKTVFGTNEDEGPIVNTGFVYYPLTKTVTLQRKIGGVNDNKFGIFIRKLLRQTNTVTSKSSKFQMDILPDLTKLERLNNTKHIKKLEYSFAMPENISSQKSENRPIFGDFFLAERLGGQSMKVQIRAEEMNVSQTIQKVKQMINFLGKDKLTSLKVVTEHNDIEEPLDLLTNKFSDYIDVSLKKGQKETVIVIMDTVHKIFENQKTLIEKMYINDQEEE